MQQRGRQHEARRIGHAGRIDRHLGAVRIAVEDRKRPDQSHGDGHRRLDPDRDDGAEHDHRRRDTEFNERHRDAGHSGRAARRHHQHEARGHEPECAAAELPGEEADRDHRQDMVEAAERMGKAMHEAVPVAVAGMREGGGRDEQNGGGDGAGERIAHDDVLLGG